MTFSEALKRFRKDSHLMQKEIAEKLGMKPSLYQRYESGETVPAVTFLLKMANTFNVSADYLLGLSDEPHAKKYDDEEVQEAFALRDALKKVMMKNGN